MNGIGFVNIVCGAVQLVVPSYALRLVRRFGAERVGWFLVTAFVSLALLHLAAPARTLAAAGAASLPLQLILAGASVLLLIGMSHLETLLSERLQANREGMVLRSTLESQVQARTADLVAVNAGLLRELGRREETEKVLRDLESQYRQLFMAHPHPLLLFELESLQILAANKAAGRQYGFAVEELCGLNARDLVPTEAIGAFVQDASIPCRGAEVRGVWRHRRRDLSTIEVEVTAVDLPWGNTPARLIVAQDIFRRPW